MRPGITVIKNNYCYLSETGNHVINMELTRIEQYWLVDSDAKRPGKFTKDMTSHSIRKLSKTGKFTKDMTSHSIRKLSKNILARQTKLPGVSRKYNKDSKRAYVKLNWHICGAAKAKTEEYV